MNFVEFIQEARSRAAGSGDEPEPASALVSGFLENNGYEDCAPQQLLALADIAIQAGDAAVARDILDRVIASGEILHLAHHKHGELELARGNWAAALAQFVLGREADPDFPFNWIGEARALHAQGYKHEALASAERFIGFGVRPYADVELTILSDLGDVLFDAGDRRRSLPFYEFVVRFGADQPRDAVRLAEALIVAENPGGAQAVLLAQEARGRLDEWGRRALALAHSRLGDHTRALQDAETALYLKPDNDGFVGTYLDVLVRGGDTAAFSDALARHGEVLTPDAVCELSARLKVHAGDFAGAAAELIEAEIVYQGRLYYLLFETAYKALAADLPDLAMMLGDRLGAVAADEISVKLLRIEVLFRQQMWEQAAILLANMSEADNQRPHVALRRFELACFTGDTATAQAMCDALETMVLPDREFMLPVFRFLAERQVWNHLVDRALPWLDEHFNYAQIGYVLFRAAKHTGRHAQMIAGVEAINGWQGRPDLVKLRANLACDCADTLFAIDRLARDPTISSDVAFRHRLAVQRDVLARAMALARRRAVFFCTDRNYLCATMVALHTATRAAEPGQTDFFVVAEDDSAELARSAVVAFTELGVSVTIVPASDVVTTADKLYGKYGVFTSGHLMASAAYYRIYFARYLQELGGYDRAVYLDSDVLVRGKLNDLFESQLGGRPLAARLEPPARPEVRRAIAMHGLTDQRYFNSGVILFDLTSDRLSAGLDGAVHAIVDKATPLMFHDQCALNLGFRSDFTDLDQAWNYPVSEATSLDGIERDAAVLHFVDRPKPWSAAYGGEAGALWFDHWRDTAAFIGEAAAVAIFAEIQD